MKSHPVELTEQEYKTLNSLYPASKGSSVIGRRAEALVKIYFNRTHPGCAFDRPDAGADLKVLLPGATTPLNIEIKGTASVGLALQQLKASSAHSWRLLTEGLVPVYRVSEVFSAVPRMFVLVHGTDFVLHEEDRWAFKAVAKPRTQQSPRGARAPSGAKHLTNQPHASKYDALRKHLEREGGDNVTVSFTAAAKLLGSPLPPSAYTHQAFWANQTDTTRRPWARAWQEAGYEVESYRLSEKDGWVRFRRRTR